MGQEIIHEIDYCLQLVSKLEKQLEENEASFSNAVSRVISAPYSAGADTAAEQCRKLRNELNRLRTQELTLLMEEQ